MMRSKGRMPDRSWYLEEGGVLKRSSLDID